MFFNRYNFNLKKKLSTIYINIKSNDIVQYRMFLLFLQMIIRWFFNIRYSINVIPVGLGDEDGNILFEELSVAKRLSDDSNKKHIKCLIPTNNMEKKMSGDYYRWNIESDVVRAYEFKSFNKDKSDKNIPSVSDMVLEKNHYGSLILEYGFEKESHGTKLIENIDILNGIKNYRKYFMENIFTDAAYLKHRFLKFYPGDKNDHIQVNLYYKLFLSRIEYLYKNNYLKEFDFEIDKFYSKSKKNSFPTLQINNPTNYLDLKEVKNKMPLSNKAFMNNVNQFGKNYHLYSMFWKSVKKIK